MILASVGGHSYPDPLPIRLLANKTPEFVHFGLQSAKHGVTYWSLFTRVLEKRVVGYQERLSETRASLRWQSDVAPSYHREPSEKS